MKLRLRQSSAAAADINTNKKIVLVNRTRLQQRDQENRITVTEPS